MTERAGFEPTCCHKTVMRRCAGCPYIKKEAKLNEREKQAAAHVEDTFAPMPRPGPDCKYCMQDIRNPDRVRSVCTGVCQGGIIPQSTPLLDMIQKQEDDAKRAKFDEAVKSAKAATDVYTIPRASKLRKQVGGDHYVNMAIQPLEYILANNIPFAEGAAIKYISRWRNKGGIQDLRKAIQTLEVIIEHEEAKLARGDK